MGAGTWAPLLLLGAFALTVHCSRVSSGINSDILRLPGPPLGEDFSGVNLRYLLVLSEPTLL